MVHASHVDSTETSDGLHVILRYELVCILFSLKTGKLFAEKAIDYVEI